MHIQRFFAVYYHRQPIDNAENIEQITVCRASYLEMICLNGLFIVG
jgi:hypothetical protein